ncbi:hypothetical protein [Thermaurantiacus sp.]
MKPEFWRGGRTGDEVGEELLAGAAGLAVVAAAMLFLLELVLGLHLTG